MTDVSVWLLTGFIAGLLDYSLAVGFGLVASIVLVSIFGYEPRSVIGAAALAQLVTVIASLTAHSRVGNISIDKHQVKALALIAVVSTVSGLTVSTAIALLNPTHIETLYTVGLAALALALLAPTPHQKHFILSILYALAAGAFKSLVGGGYGALIARSQMLVGLNARNALALATAIKLPLFILVAIVYSRYYGLNEVVLLALGGLASTPIAAQIVRKMKEGLAVNASSLVTLIGLAAKLTTKLLPAY